MGRVELFVATHKRVFITVPDGIACVDCKFLYEIDPHQDTLEALKYRYCTLFREILPSYTKKCDECVERGKL